MGRARITLKHISNERSCKTIFLRRKRGLMKKVSEFSKKCGGEHCLIVYDGGNGDVGPVTSPQNPVEVHSMIQKYYESQLKNWRPHKTYGIEEFIENRKNMIEAEISRVDKQISSIKYPTWDPSIINMEEDQLRTFCAHVDAKIEACGKGIKLLKNKPQGFVPNMSQKNTTATTPLPNQVNYLQSISQSEVLLDPVDPPLNSTNELTELEFEELIMGLSSCDWPYQACDDHVGCSSEARESILPSICDQYQNEQQGGRDLHVLSSPLDLFQTNYYNMFS